MRKKLVLTDGTRERELQLAGRIVVGRDPVCEISYDDSLLSRRHAEFITVGESVTLRDLGSRNGVFVNGARTVEHRLEPDDVVQIGPLRARYVVGDAASPIVPATIDSDRTEVIRKVFGAQMEPGGSLAGAVATLDGDDDEEVTRLVPAPRLSPGTVVERAYVKTKPDDEEPTLFMRASPSGAAESSSAPPRVDSNALQTTFVQVLAVSTFVLVTAAVPLLLRMSAAWLALPLVIAVAGSYVVAASTNRVDRT